MGASCSAPIGSVCAPQATDQEIIEEDKRRPTLGLQDGSPESMHVTVQVPVAVPASTVPEFTDPQQAPEAPGGAPEGSPEPPEVSQPVLGAPVGAAPSRSLQFAADVEREATAGSGCKPSVSVTFVSEHSEAERQRRLSEWRGFLEETRRQMVDDSHFGTHGPANRYGHDSELPPFEPSRHVPTLALINPMSGAMAGGDILALARRTSYYQERFFNIIDVVKGQRPGGLLDVFRIELCAAKEEAKAMGTRPRVISGGGDGTGSFALFIIFLALKAHPAREEEGLADKGNGFIWTDKELEESFPALAQMPLGSANDFGNILGWGQKYPGDGAVGCCHSRAAARNQLYKWIEAVIDQRSKIVNFDLWGIMPQKGADACDFKLAELTGVRGRCPNKKVEGQRQLQLKEAGKPVPFFICLYFSAGFGAYMTARFQINRRKTPIQNRLEYTRQALGIIAESTPPQLNLRLNGVEIDCEDGPYFPPRRHRGTMGRGYREVGFYNINWQAHALHGASRAGVFSRLFSRRKPVTFNDGQLDMFRWKFASLLKNPGLRIQTDKRKEMELTFKGGRGKGVFFQWDGEARFAFSPKGDPFHIFIRKIMNIPVVIGPYVNKNLTGDLDNGHPVKFAFAGETQEDRDLVVRRILQNVAGELDAELNGSIDEILDAGLKVASNSANRAVSTKAVSTAGKI